MSSQPNEEDPMMMMMTMMMMDPLLEFTDLQEPAVSETLFRDRTDTDHHHHHHHHLRQDATVLDHNLLHGPTTSETAVRVMDGEETRGKGVGIVVDELHEHGHDEKDGSSCGKKKEHNAKERLRRMKLHSSFLSLGTLLPDPKKKWSAPAIIDRVLTYVPELQMEIEQLTLKKQQITTAISEKNKLLDEEKSFSSRGSDPIPTVTVHEVGHKREAIIQICTRNEREDAFTDLLNTIESQGMIVLSASTARICADQRIFGYHLHVKMNDDDSFGTDYIAVIKEKITSSLV